MNEPIASFEAITHRFGDISVIDDVTYELEPGTVTALVGANGSGKTTLLRIVAGLLAPTSGRVELPTVNRPVGHLPQNPDFRATFTVEETLRFYASLLDADADVAAALDRVGLRSVRDRRVEDLSGGMRRLLGVAQAMLGDPPVVLFDEPTGDLDPRMTEHIFDVAAAAADDGAAVFLATHNVEGAARADAVLVLDHGRFVARGTPADIVAANDGSTLQAAFLAVVGDDQSISVPAEVQR